MISGSAALEPQYHYKQYTVLIKRTVSTPSGVQFFPFRVDPFSDGRQNISDKVTRPPAPAPTESVLIFLEVQKWLTRAPLSGAIYARGVPLLGNEMIN